MSGSLIVLIRDAREPQIGVDSSAAVELAMPRQDAARGVRDVNSARETEAAVEGTAAN